jgi:hypothetical protein
MNLSQAGHRRCRQIHSSHPPEHAATATVHDHEGIDQPLSPERFYALIADLLTATGIRLAIRGAWRAMLQGRWQASNFIPLKL